MAPVVAAEAVPVAAPAAAAPVPAAVAAPAAGSDPAMMMMMMQQQQQNAHMQQMERNEAKERSERQDRQAMLAMQNTQAIQSQHGATTQGMQSQHNTTAHGMAGGGGGGGGGTTVMMAGAPVNNGPNVYGGGLFGCFDDIPSCVIGYFCPCVTAGMAQGQITSKSDFGGSFVVGCLTWSVGYGCLLAGMVTGVTGLVAPCLWMSLTTKVKTVTGVNHIQAHSAPTSYLSHCFCPQCAACQDYRAAKEWATRGGVQGGLLMQQQTAPVMMAPVQTVMVQGGM